MEQGGPACMDEIIAKRESIFAAFNDYLETVEKHYFVWGYRACLDDMGKNGNGGQNKSLRPYDRRIFKSSTGR